MLAALFEDPQSPEDWLRYSYHHRDSHTRIRQALQRKGINVPDYPLDPITGPHLGEFLQFNSQMHNDMNGALRLQGVDLLSVDFNDVRQRIAWLNLHAKQHEDAEKALGI